MNSASDGDGAERSLGSDIAIIGMAGRFPGAHSVEQFWANVRAGVESIRTLTDDELLAAGVTRTELSDPGYVKACPVLDDIDKFDASFFGFSPREASVMDPAHRFFLEVAWQAVEHAGYTALPHEGPVGVFAGSGAPLYMYENLVSNPELMRSMGDFLVRHTGNDMNFLATRVSYEMDLRGPSINVQTACSSALVALHLACQSLLRGECSVALAGGSTVLIPNARGYLYKDGEIASRDGHCRPFDARSTGTVFGSGTGCVVLKRLQDALDDGDTIHAVVKGSAINNDGAVKVGYLAPGVDGQAEVITKALAVAGVSADSIGYVETHGTGTLVGDPIEVEALNQAFRAQTARRKFCGIGSVKSNIGHLGEAAASASLIKAIMALKHRELPPSLGFEQPNPAIDFDDSPFYVNASLRAWESEGPRRCGITALGAGGTNCHVILEEPPEALEGEGARSRQLFVLSAKTRGALERAANNLADALEAQPELDLADAAFTLALGRRSLPQRRVVVASDRQQAITRLRAHDVKQQASTEADTGVVFMFPGGGAQYARMGIELYESESVYRDALDACLEWVEPTLGQRLREQMLASPERAERATRELERPSLTIPSLFATEYALAKLLMSWGLAPIALVGHSMGEYVAACLAGVFSLPDAMRLVVLRGRLFEAVEPGSMLSVPLSEAVLRPLMSPDLSIAAINGPELTVASGPAASIEKLAATLSERELEFTRVRIAVAAHSSMLDPILGPFRELCRSIELEAPTIPIASNLTGRWLLPQEATDPEYWVQHLRNSVRFGECIQTVLAGGARALLEVGPGRTLSTLARAQPKPAQHVFGSMRHPQEAASDLEYALTTLGRLWAAGVAVDWSAFYEGQLRNRVPLPTYPFEQQSYWVEPGRLRERSGAVQELSKREDTSSWFYALSWMEQPVLSGERAAEGKRWLIIAHDRRQARALEKALGGDFTVVVTPGEALVRETTRAWWLDFRSSEQVSQLFQAFDDNNERFDHVVYLAGSSRTLPDLGELKHLEQLQALSQNFYGLTYVARSVGALAEPIQLSIVTTELSDVGGQRIDPLRALALGPAFVTPRELPQVHTRCIDISSRPLHTGRAEALEQLVRELRAESPERLIALRRGQRWVRRAVPLPVPQVQAAPTWLRQHGVYLITGGLGGIGLEVAKHLARQAPVKLALWARSALPPEASWDAIVSNADPSNLAAQRIKHVRELRALGAQVQLLVGDVSDRERMRELLAGVRAQLGPLTGVIHAAGLLDDQPMQLKTPAAMRSVLAPKVQGTLLLDELIDEELDFFVLFSSVASVLGLPGQVDYTAANAFLDAFARAREQRVRRTGRGGRTLVINWNAWRDVGMAEAARHGLARGLDALTPSAHPALDGYSEQAGARTFTTHFSSERHWLLAEHRIKDSFALLPGTAFVELARAAFSEGRSPAPIELSNLTFLSPFQVAPGETRSLSIDLAASGGGYHVSMRSGSDFTSAPHVVGEVRNYIGAAPARLDIGELRRSCDLRVEAPAGGFLDQDFVVFGGRWANIARVHYGRSEALLELALRAEYRGDVESYGLHPALLDMATGGAQALIPNVDLDTDFYVPLSYERIVIFGAMPARLFSFVRCLPESGDGLAYFDITLTTPEGDVFAEITRFTMKRLDARSALTAATSVEVRADSRRHDAMAAVLREAMHPAEALAAFDRVMAQPTLAQAIVSSVDVIAWQAQLDELAKATGVQAAEPAMATFARPELDSAFEAPTTPSELALAEIWSELLGLGRIGVHDDFFELGGNSLVAVRLFAAIKKRFRVSLPLASLFEAPTIRQLSALLELPGELAAPAPEGKLRKISVTEPARVDAPLEPPTSSRYTPLVLIQQGSGMPFFCVHGAGGNILNFQALAKQLGADQTFYGLQAKGVTGGEPAHSIEEMAQMYVEAIRRVRPNGPYVLGGYSGGGVVAYEMGQRLRAAGEEVLLAFLDTFHPASRTFPPTLQQRLEYLVAEGTPYLVRTGMAKLTRVVEGLRDDARTRYYQRRGVALPLELRNAQITGAFDRAAAAYELKRYDGPVTLFRARTIAPMFAHVGPTLGWGELVPKLEIIEVPGDHTTLMVEPNVQFLISHLRALIATAVERPSPASNISPASAASPLTG